MTAPRRNERERTMSFWDHLEELRWRIIKSIIAVILGGLASLVFSDAILTIILLPVERMKNVQLVNLTPLSMVMVRLYIALVVGIVVALPIVVHQLWAFVAPGLYKPERKAIVWVIMSTMLLFATGAALSYAMMPYLLGFLVEAGYSGVANMWNIRDYVGFLLGFMTAFGVVFELPVVIYILSLVGIVSPAFLRRYRRHAVVLVFIISAILTPSPDPFSMLAMAAPLWLLFEVSIHVSAMVWKRKARRRLAEIEERERAEAKGE